MIERNWDRRPCGIRAYPHLLMTPPFVFLNPIAGRASKRPISVYTALSELRFVADEDEDTLSPLYSDTNPSPISHISQLQFASPEETMALITPTESAGPSSREPSLPFSVTNPSSPGVREEQALVTPSERLPSTTIITSPSPQQTGWPMPRPVSAAILGPVKIGRRPLPDVPEPPQSRPLPPRPTEATTVPCFQDLESVSYPPRQEFIQRSLDDPLTPSQYVLHSVQDTRSQSAGEKRPKLDPTPGDTPPALHLPAIIISPPPDTFFPPPTITIPIILPTTPKPNYPATILPDLLSPTSIDLVTAAGLTITGENGEQVLFGALFRDRKVIVILIRHFWCLFCQNYVRSISNIVTPEILRNRGVDLVLIGNGAPGMIKAYKSMPSVVQPI
jgi:hypothetical protein